MWRWVLAVGPSLVCSACALDAPISLAFSDVRPFLWSESAMVVVFEDGSCSDRQAEVRLGRFEEAYFSSGFIPACSLLNGELIVEDLPAGSATYLATARAADGQEVARGCTPNIDPQAEGRVVIEMGPSVHFLNELQMADPPCDTPEAKCSTMCGSM